MSETPQPHVYQHWQDGSHCAICGHHVSASWHTSGGLWESLSAQERAFLGGLMLNWEKAAWERSERVASRALRGQWEVDAALCQVLRGKLFPEKASET